MRNLGVVDIAIFDEAHYINAEKWHDAVTALRTSTNCISIGVTATPQRFEDQGTKVTIIDEFGGNSVGNYTNEDLQKAGVFVKPKYIVSLAHVDDEIAVRREELNADESIYESRKEALLKSLDRVESEWTTKCSPSIVIRDQLHKYMYKESGNKILVFTKDTSTLEDDKAYILGMLKEQFPQRKIHCYDYTYKSGDKSLQEFLDDTDCYISVLFSINRVCETIHISDLNVLMCLRKTASNRIIIQQLGRVNDINNKNKSLIIDMVDNVEMLEHIVEPKSDYIKGFSGDYKPLINGVDVDLTYATRTVNIFKKIDNAIGRIYYDIGKYRGTLKDVCYVLKKDYDAVKYYINKGYSLDEALNSSRTLKRTKDVSETDYNFKLTESESLLVSKYSDLVLNLTKKRRCSNEDIIADLNLYLCFAVHEYFSEVDIRNISAYQFVYKKVNRRLNQLIRSELNNEESKIFDFDDSDLGYNPFMSESFYEDDEAYNVLFELIQTKLTDREKFVLCSRYGLQDFSDRLALDLDCQRSKTYDEVGKQLDVTRGRIHQIEMKAIRKLRKPENWGKLRGSQTSSDRDKITWYFKAQHLSYNTRLIQGHVPPRRIVLEDIADLSYHVVNICRSNQLYTVADILALNGEYYKVVKSLDSEFIDLCINLCDIFNVHFVYDKTNNIDIDYIASLDLSNNDIKWYVTIDKQFINKTNKRIERNVNPDTILIRDITVLPEVTKAAFIVNNIKTLGDLLKYNGHFDRITDKSDSMCAKFCRTICKIYGVDYKFSSYWN